MTTPAIRTHVHDEYVIRLRCVCVLTFVAEGHSAAWDADGEGRGGGEGMALPCSCDRVRMTNILDRMNGQGRYLRRSWTLSPPARSTARSTPTLVLDSFSSDHFVQHHS